MRGREGLNTLRMSEWRKMEETGYPERKLWGGNVGGPTVKERELGKGGGIGRSEIVCLDEHVPQS